MIQAYYPDENRVSRHFTWAEVTQETLHGALYRNMVYIINVYGERIRALLDRPIIVNSGYRTEEHNQEVGGSKTSRHLFALALDLTWEGINETDVLKVFKHVYNETHMFLPTQMIWYPEHHFIHVGFTYPGKNTEMLIKEEGEYHNWIVP